MNCPICNTTINDIKGNPFCPICHYELVEIPSTASPGLIENYKMTFDIFKTSYDESANIMSLNEDLKNINKENTIVRKELAQLRSKIEAKQAELNEANDELKRQNSLQQKIIAKNAELKEIEKAIVETEQKLGKNYQYINKLEELLKVYNQACYKGYGDKLKDIEHFLKDKNNCL